MRRSRILIAVAAAALVVPALAANAGAATRSAANQSSQGAATSYVVLAEAGSSALALAQQLRAGGATVSSVNQDIGLLTVSSTDTGFAGRTRHLTGVHGVGQDRSIGYLPRAIGSGDAVEQEAQLAHGVNAAPAVSKAKGGKPGDPLDSLLWGMDMINAPEAHHITTGDHRVTVGVLDTGVEGFHPDSQDQLQHEAVPQLRHRHA